MAVGITHGPDGPHRLEQLAIERLDQLALDDLVVLEWAGGTVVGRVGITIGERAVELSDGAGDWYRVDREGVVRRVSGSGVGEVVGEDASVQVVREVVPDGGTHESAGEVNPSELPYETAPEYAERFGSMLGMERHVVDEAAELATRYSLEEPIAHEPRTTAAGSLYLAGFLNNRKRSQTAIAEVADVNPHTISVAYRRMAIEEGYDITPPAVDQEDDEEVGEDGGESFLERLGEFLRGGEA